MGRKIYLGWAILLLAGCSQNCGGQMQPSVAYNRVSSALVYYNDCPSLEQDLKNHLIDEMTERLTRQKEQYIEGGGFAVLEGGAPTAGGPEKDTSTRQYSETNVQEAGVDEADIVKTDGDYLYVLNGKLLEVVGVPEPGQLNRAGSVKFDNIAEQMLLDGNQAVVFSRKFSGYYYAGGGVAGRPMEQLLPFPAPESFTYLDVVDLTNRENPRIKTNIKIDGDYQAARKIGSKIFVVTNYLPLVKGIKDYPEVYPENIDYENKAALRAYWEPVFSSLISKNRAIINDSKLQDLVPHIWVDGEQKDLAEQGCQNFAIADGSLARSFTSVITLDLNDLDPKANHLVSNGGVVYASQNALLIAEPAEEPWLLWNRTDLDEATYIHRFAIGADAETQYSGSGQVTGSVLNQFSLSEYNGDIRVVTTSGNIWRFDQRELKPENHLFVLRGVNKLEQIGELDEPIAPGERIWSARFVGDKAYVVTFRNVDPLFVIDLANPEIPQVLGELKVTGVSTYIHPLGDNHLLTIGFGGDSERLDWSTTVSQFDVSDYTSPDLVDRLRITPRPENEVGEWMNSYSEAVYEHKAFTYFEPAKLLAIPVSAYRYQANDVDYASKVALINVEAGEDLTTYYDVAHSDFFGDEENYFVNPDVRRVIFIGNAGGPYFVYAISSKGVTVTEVSDMEPAKHRDDLDLHGDETFQEAGL